MYELIRVTDRCLYMDCPAKVGLYRVSETEVVAIDSGSDKDAAKKLLRHLDAQGWKLTKVLNTHSHADHTGGNKLLQDRTGCKVYAPGIDRAFTEFPLLEPALLWGGCPFPELKHKFLMAQESRAEALTESILPEGLKALPLPGHCFDMTGFIASDGTVFLADCVSSAETLEKYGLGYLWDPEAALDTLERVKTLQGHCFIPAHAPVCSDIIPLAQKNIDAIRTAEERILSLCAQPVTFEELLQKLFTAYGLTMNAQQYALIGSTLRSYLSCFVRDGRAGYRFEDNRMLWQATAP